MSKRVLLVSSDGHAAARMRDYRPFLEKKWQDSFDEFVKLHEQVGSRNFDPPALRLRVDSEAIEEWDQAATGRLESDFDATLRIKEQDREGICAEVIFPESCIPFLLSSLHLASTREFPPATIEQIDAGNQAYNRWLIDFCSHAPERFAPMALVSFHDVDAAIQQFGWARNNGFKGVVLPFFSVEFPLYHAKFDPIWSALVDLDMIANSHTGNSGAVLPHAFPAPMGEPELQLPLFAATPVARQILPHMIWGGVLERHPDLKVVFTEQGSGWVVQDLQRMDYTYEHAFSSGLLHKFLKLKPSEYFARQCYLGSSLFSEPEMAARYDIGVDKLMLGVDFPHHEGAWMHTTKSYLQATLGVAGVPEDEARTMCGESALSLFEFDRDKLEPITEQIGFSIEEILEPPTEEKFPRGDVHRPL